MPQHDPQSPPPGKDGRPEPTRGLDLRARIALAGEVSERELAEWLCEDQVRGWRSGRRIPAEAYLALLDGRALGGDAVFEVVYNEFLLRESLGERPDLDEYHWRFPALADRLRRQLSLHRALAGDENEPEEATLGDEPPRLPGAPEIPGYAILGELGRGGAGVVYRALQLGLNRQVALKVIRFGADGHPAAITRFRAEAEAVARFQHPNIIQVHEVGEYEGLGYLTLEYAAGGSLATSIAGSPQDPVASAALLETLARAIHHAHCCGIVHRDLKPANVVLTEGRQPKITDFGLAKLLAHDAGATATGSILGTPSYMAPEQLYRGAREITPAADTYALGAIFYELLTGRPPFRAATPLSTLEQVANQEPLPPGRLRAGTPPDLETICLKCLEKEPARRYPSALALADDLRRFLDGRPILVRPATAWERVFKWARRRPAAATALTLMLISLGVIVAGVVHYNNLLRAGMQTARAARAEAERNARAAAEQSRLALAALGKLVFEVQERLGEEPATRPLRRSLLDTAVAGLDRIATEAEANPPNLTRAVAHQKLGAIYRQVGRADEATRQFEQAIRLADDLEAATPRDLAVKDCLIRALIGLGEIRIAAGEPSTAVEHFLRVGRLAEDIDAADASRPGARRGLLEAYIRLGRAYGYLGSFDDARPWIWKSVLLADRWALQEPTSAEASAMLAWSYRKLGDIGKLSGNRREAREAYLKAIGIGRARLASHPTDSDARDHLAAALNDLGQVERAERDLATAGPLLAEAEALFTELAAHDPEDVGIHIKLAHARRDHARLLVDARQFTRAAQTYFHAIEELRGVPAERIPSRADDDLRPATLERELAQCQVARDLAGRSTRRTAHGADR